MTDGRESPAPSDGSVEFLEKYSSEVRRCEEQFRNVAISENLPRQMMKTRPDEVRNTAGGYVFPVSDETRIRRFIIFGTSGGTYYSSEKELTMDNVKAMIDIIEKSRGSLILKEIYEISLAGRNPKQDPLLMALALCARYNVCDNAAKMRQAEKASEALVAAKHKYLSELHKSALGIVNDVCRIPTHLFAFVKYFELISQSTQPEEGKKSTGWGRLMRLTIQDWYASKAPEQLAMHLTKYPQRGGWSHRDLFRLAHPTLKEKTEENSILEYEQLYHFAVKGELRTRKRDLPKDEADIAQPAKKYSAVQMDVELESRALQLVEAVLTLKYERNEGKIVEDIKTHNLVREHIPTEMLNSVPVWQALLAKMPMTAMIRNLGKMQSIGAITPEHRDNIIAKLTNEEELKRARIHPLQVLLAKTVYQAGHGDKGKLEWNVDKKIDKALEDAFYKSFVNAPPTNKRFCFAFDVSGSMCTNISGTMLSCRTASAALSLVECVGFSEKLVELPFRGDWTISKIEDYMNGMKFGATDCALPMLWAKKKNKKFDVFVVYTDCETWFGKVLHYFCLTVSVQYYPILRLGFDSAVPTLLADFVNGEV
ncbi:hypothetical protein Aduo_011728 [Ancylostoma duodenale]